jgi:hypothetical protein
VASEWVDGSGSSRNLTTMRCTARDEVFLACLYRNLSSVNDERAAALHNHQVFVVVMDMFRGGRVFTAGPECHLVSVCPVEPVILNSGRGLIGAGDPVGGMLPELREGVYVTAASLRCGREKTDYFQLKVATAPDGRV